MLKKKLKGKKESMIAKRIKFKKTSRDYLILMLMDGLFGELSKSQEDKLSICDCYYYNENGACTSCSEESLSQRNCSYNYIRDRLKCSEYRRQALSLKDKLERDFANFTEVELSAFIYKSYGRSVKKAKDMERMNFKNIFLGLYDKGELGISKIAELMKWDVETTYDFVKKERGISYPEHND